MYHDYMHAAGIWMGTIQARTHVQLAFACQQSMIRVLRFTMQHVRGHGVTNVLNIPLHLAHSDSLLATTLPHAGFILTLTLLCVLMAL